MQATNRLYFLDWVRVLAFFVLIFYHTGMYYVTWGWHIKSPFASDTIEPFMMLSSPWRLGLLFLVSGVASRFILGKLSAGRFARSRSKRLLLPLLFGMFFIVPPQPFFEVIEKFGFAGSYLDFMKLYVTGYHGFCQDGKCLDLPTWNHLWFVAYLWVYTILLAGLVALLGKRFDAISEKVAAFLGGWRAIAVPLAFLAVMRIWLYANHPATNNLVNDWYNHAYYFPLFLLGAMVGPHLQFWQQMEKVRWVALFAGLSAWAIIICLNSMPDAMWDSIKSVGLLWTARSIYAACQWCPMVAIFGFAYRHLNFDSSKRRYLTEAVFPFYIVHQSVIIIFAFALKPLRMAPHIEGMVLVVLTFGTCFAVFEVVRRVPLLRPCFGLTGKERSKAAVELQAGMAT